MTEIVERLERQAVNVENDGHVSAARAMLDAARILATGLVPDEAAIRADERERCAREAERTPLNSYDAGECRADIAAAIRAGGAK